MAEEDASSNNAEVKSLLAKRTNPKPDARVSRQYTPSFLLEKGQFELRLFNNIYTQRRFWDANGEAQNIFRDLDGNGNTTAARATYYAGILNFLAGVTPRINAGIDIWFRAVSITKAPSSPLAILSFPTNNFSRKALSGIGPKLKVLPFKKIPHLSIQSAFLFPVANDPQGYRTGQEFLDSENYLSWTQMFYDYYFTSRLQLFAEIDFFWYIDRKNEPKDGRFDTPVSLFLSYFPTSKFTIYGMSQFWPTYGENLFSAYFFQAGLGVKYQLARQWELEASHGRFLFGKNTAGSAQTYNLGIRFLWL